VENLKVKKHKERPDLTGEHPFGDLGQLIFLFVFIAVWLADIFVFKIDESEFFEVSMWIRIPLGVIILICSLFLKTKSTKMVFGMRAEKPEVIVSNIYKKVRHPMYLSLLLFYLSIIIFIYSLPLFLVYIPIVLFYNYIAKYEEKLLVKRFGDDYRQYMKKVKRWIPQFKTKY